MRKSSVMLEREEAKMVALTERYYVKKALLDTWRQSRLDEHDYVQDLARRVRGHHNDILYRGGIIEH